MENIKITFDKEASDDFLSTIFVNGESIKSIAHSLKTSEDAEKPATENTVKTADILDAAEKEFGALSAHNINQHVMKNIDKYGLGHCVMASMIAGVLSAEQNPMTKFAMMIKASQFDTLTDMVIDFHDDPDVVKKTEEELGKDEHVWAVLNFVGTVVETAT